MKKMLRWKTIITVVSIKETRNSSITAIPLNTRPYQYICRSVHTPQSCEHLRHRSVSQPTSVFYLSDANHNVTANRLAAISAQTLQPTRPTPATITVRLVERSRPLAYNNTSLHRPHARPGHRPYTTTAPVLRPVMEVHQQGSIESDLNLYRYAIVILRSNYPTEGRTVL